jgi:hypothetical protein
MDIKNDRKLEALCKFGPGGEYTSVWPFGSDDPILAAENKLSKVLKIISKLMQNQPAINIEQKLQSLNISEDVILESVLENEEESVTQNVRQNKQHNAAPDTTVEGNSGIQDQRMLFSVDNRLVKSSGNKQKHNVRTHHRASKKRTACRYSAQGSLFGADFEVAKSA